MGKIKISTDSTADIPKVLAKKFDIEILPMIVLIDGREYLDGVDIKQNEFYKILDSCDELPVTSQVPTSLYLKFFEETWKSGYTDLVHVAINSKASGSFNNALLSRNIFFEEHPEAKNGFKIHVVDSKSYSMVYGMPVIEVAQLAQQGFSSSEILEHINERLRKLHGIFVPLELKFIKKSGRVPAAAAFIGELLGLKPIFTIEDGEVKIISKVRGEKRAISALAQIFADQHYENTDYTIVCAENLEVAYELKKKCENFAGKPPFAVVQASPALSINSGSNMIGIVFRS